MATTEMKVLDRHGNPMRASGEFRPTARYLRDTRSNVLSTRPAPLTESRDDIRQAWTRTAGLALDLIKNSGRLKGAADQVLADTVGSELQLNPKPDLSSLGYDDKERADWCRLVKRRWKLWSWNEAECDFRGKFTLPQLVDISLRWHMAYGEVTGILDYMDQAKRQRYGIRTGTKLCLTPPSRLVQDTSEIEGLFQGVYHDENGRPAGYLFEERNAGFVSRKSYPARDASGRKHVLHVFDPMDATDVRGISVMASAFRKHIQHEMLDDATLQTAILQTIFAATLTSEKPTMEAFEALETLKDTGVEGASEYAEEYTAFLQSSLEKAAEGQISLSGDPQISHLAPGERFEVTTAGTPGGQYLPFSNALSRDMARAIGITYGGLTMDHTNATYSSVRMETSSIWPVVGRRRQRIAAPVCQAVYESWLDEEIGTGRIPFKGGRRAYEANRERVSWAQWQGPPKPTADDNKSARASTERLGNGTSSIEIEAAELGLDTDELFEQRRDEHNRYLDAGMPSPYEQRQMNGQFLEEDPQEKKKEGAAS
ncbi:phage portal protein [Roseibium polysiphoniae]|uniref:Phage portal protein n=1 Tax=Roseibium polysiphoniae TaxID=2571221 RepID=A0A944CC68_9HYPH|nr:phage portal protein [Roseibium polysiphoniae]MBS8259737.1 phage portal protein [Roseibium polysiphoniae]